MFWSEVVNQSGWRVQYNRTLDTILSPQGLQALDRIATCGFSGRLRAELAQAIPQLILEFGEKNPLFTREDVARTLIDGRWLCCCK